MNIRQSLRTALRAILANKLRSGLTMLGIIIGVGAVVTMVSIGKGAASSVTTRIQSLGSNLLTITSESPNAGFAGARQAGGGGTTLKLEDAEAIVKAVPAVESVSPEYSGQAQIVYLNSNVNTSIRGVVEGYQDVNNFHVSFGEFISQDDNKLQSRVAVLGQETATTLFDTESPVGKYIKVGSIPFKVIGVMEQKGQQGFFNRDDVVFVPLSTAQKRLFGADNLRQITVKVKSEDEMTLAQSQITAILLQKHKIDNEAEADFSIRNQADMLETVSAVSGTLTLLLGGIAAISLIVGGIGIMNIMLVSVTERTREIGLRKAVGAKRRDILIQFLIEALILCFFGAIIGVIIGVIGSIAASKIGGWPTVVTASSVIIAFIFSTAIGLFFGIYPARRASMLSPISALKFE